MNNKYVFLDIDISNRNALFEFISKKSIDLEIIDKENSQKLVEALLKREQETSTGFENGFAIPHARIAEIKKTAVLYVRLKNGIDWKSLDNKPTKYVIFLLVPEKNASNQHMELLSNIAVGLLNKDFTSIIESSNDVDKIADSFENQMEAKKSDNKKSELELTKNKLILAITACPVGIAHTYLAAEKISEAAKKLNYQVKVETHGSVGVKDEFTKDEIDRAEVIIISADISVDTSRFVGKRIFKTNIKSAIKDSNNLIENALKSGKKETENSSGNNSSVFNSGEKQSYFVKHLLSGVSYMIPFIIFGGLLIALSLGLTQIIYGKNIHGTQITSPPHGSPLWYILNTGVISFTLMIPILAGFIANSIGGRAAIAPAAVVAMISNTSELIYMFPGLVGHHDQAPTPLGFLGAIFYGFVIGYSVKWINTWKIHKNISSIMPIFVIPIVVSLFYSLFALFIINAPISWVMNKIGGVLEMIFTNNASLSLGIKIAIWIPLGALLGAMIGFDMGGPVNKIAFVTASLLLTLPSPIGNAMGMVSASIPIAPLGMGLCTLVYKKHFSSEEKTLGVSALVMGFIGISEGAIPFAISNPKKVIPTNIISSAVAGAVAGGLGVTSAVPHGGPIVGILGAVSGTFFNSNAGLQTGMGILFFFIAIASGCLTSVLFYGLLLKTNSNKSHKIKSEKRIVHNLRLNINISKITKVYLIQYIILSLGIIFTIIGISMWAVYGHEVANIVNTWKNNVSPKIPVEIIYANFTLLVGVLFLLLSFMHFFTFKDKVKNLRLK
ncbi:MAG: fructose-specific PTS transporter subunit EIIC [Mycoplasmoidaceae bacterium]